MCYKFVEKILMLGNEISGEETTNIYRAFFMSNVCWMFYVCTLFQGSVVGVDSGQ